MSTPNARWLVLFTLLSVGGCATRQISGQVIDRNGQPLDRALVKVVPGGVELITDQTGAFAFDYLRDETGARTKLKPRQEYTVEVFKPGYHVEQVPVRYERGVLILAPVTLREDTIRVESAPVDLDPDAVNTRGQSSGATYEGE
ncbi:carboxypeptidase-like regulatory domain-containing protein [Myxococcota bacterium]|nr:carboxypeptidase-like regulatory domain-containing protein [Myxococcota bacterium]